MKKTPDLTFPIPEARFLARFQDPFETIFQNRSTTLIALPHTGRTSLLYFLFSQPEWFSKLKVETKKLDLIFIDPTRFIKTLQGFLFETIQKLGNMMHDTQSERLEYLSQDLFLLTREFLLLIDRAAKHKKLCLVITLNKDCLPYLKELDHLLAQAQRAAPSGCLSIFWSIDTQVLRGYEPGHSTSALTQNFFYFPTFDHEETRYSLQRLATIKGKRIPQNLLAESWKITGGIAGPFHPFIDLAYESRHLSVSSFQEKLTESAHYQRVLKELHGEISQSGEKLDNLTYPPALDLITSFQPLKIEFRDLQLANLPTAQEIRLLDLFRQHPHEPLNRDAIAAALWGQNWEGKYSDWAIDQAIGRLRRKLKKDHCYLVTVRNFGYQLINLK